MFSKKIMDDIAKSQADASAKAERDAYSSKHGGSPEDAHSKAYSAAIKAGKNPHEAAQLAARAHEDQNEKAAKKSATDEKK